MFFWEIIKDKNWLNKSQCYTQKMHTVKKQFLHFQENPPTIQKSGKIISYMYTDLS